ncbi:MAG: VOC family protein [Candidatus Moraniibacteriota bacterium]
MKKLNPNLMVKDVKETVDFYTQNLGFSLIMAVPETQDGILTEIPKDKVVVYALVKNGDVEIMFQEEKTLRKDVPVLHDTGIGASCTFYIELENLEEFYEEVHGKVEVVKDLFTTWYGMKEFYIRDNNGYILTFAEMQKK